MENHCWTANPPHPQHIVPISGQQAEHKSCVMDEFAHALYTGLSLSLIRPFTHLWIHTVCVKSGSPYHSVLQRERLHLPTCLHSIEGNKSGSDRASRQTTPRRSSRCQSTVAFLFDTRWKLGWHLLRARCSAGPRLSPASVSQNPYLLTSQNGSGKYFAFLFLYHIASLPNRTHLRLARLPDLIMLHLWVRVDCPCIFWINDTNTHWVKGFGEEGLQVPFSVPNATSLHSHHRVMLWSCLLRFFFSPLQQRQPEALFIYLIICLVLSQTEELKLQKKHHSELRDLWKKPVTWQCYSHMLEFGDLRNQGFRKCTY